MAKEASSLDVDIYNEILSMFDSAEEMFLLTWEGFKRLDKDRLHKAERIGRELH